MAPKKPWIVVRLYSSRSPKNPRRQTVVPRLLAHVFRPRAIDELERAYRERSADVTYLKTDPLFDELRGNPRFEALVQKVFAPKKAEADSR